MSPKVNELLFYITMASGLVLYEYMKNVDVYYAVGT